MKRCLHSGRLLRYGRRLSVPLIARRTISDGHNARKITKYTLAEANNLCARYKFDHKLYPPISRKRQRFLEHWIPCLEKCLPPPSQAGTKHAHQEGDSLEVFKEDFDRASSLAGWMNRFRERFQLDPLVHMGFNLDKWEAVHAMLNSLVDAHELLVPYMAAPQASNLDWSLGSGESLDDLTSVASPHLLNVVAPDTTTSLHALTWSPTVKVFSHFLMAEVWQTLGSLVLEAANRPPKESQLAMSYVFRILARLHHSGLISERVYQYHDPDTSLRAFRPPTLHLLSGHIMSVLSDAAWLEHQAAVAARAAETGEESPYLPFKMGVRELGPEIWFELILWCCVEHGFPIEGAWLVKQMMAQNECWKVESWTPLLRDFDIVRQTNIGAEQFWRRPGNDTVSRSQDKPPFRGLGKRTISTEVATSLRNGLIHNAVCEIGTKGYGITKLLQLSSHLDSLIDPIKSAHDLRPTTKATNWHTVQLIESGAIDPENDPTSLERILRLRNEVVPAWDGDELTKVQHLDGMTRAQFYNASAAMVGLVELNIRAYARDCLTTSALHQYAWLQNIIDASTVRHTESFFEQLKQSGTEQVPFFDSQHFSSLKSSLPQVSSVTHAAILELATTSRAFDFGNWLLFSDDVDGPSIPLSAYGEQVLTPSLLRYAAATQNPQLAHQVLRSVQMPFRLNTIKTVIDYEISVGEWDRVVQMFQYIRDRKAKSWGYSNLATLAAAITRRDASILYKESQGIAVSEEEKHSLAQAQDILLRLFSGEFNSPEGRNDTNRFQQRAIYSMYSLLSSLPGSFRELFKSASLQYVPVKPEKIGYITTVSFNVLLTAIVDGYGCYSGKGVYGRWCQYPHRGLDDGSVGLELARERNHQQGGPHVDPKRPASVHNKLVIPNLDTIRIIAQAAIRELEALSDAPTPSMLKSLRFYKIKPKTVYRTTRKWGKPPKTVPEGVLDFCVEMFLREGLAEHEIDRETNGHVARMRERKAIWPSALQHNDALSRALDDRGVGDWYTPVGGWPVRPPEEVPVRD
ncbi:uncharacterized protein PFLUO_LOCUS6863 [Penicillium psychrofluorescens]|uniref:uncharacterized protein n=1 Tax=Penicillium psychrofluorescens TaxID=3158075 RepID=UPI003CCD68A1